MVVATGMPLTGVWFVTSMTGLPLYCWSLFAGVWLTPLEVSEYVSVFPSGEIWAYQAGAVGE